MANNVQTLPRLLWAAMTLTFASQPTIVEAFQWLNYKPRVTTCVDQTINLTFNFVIDRFENVSEIRWIFNNQQIAETYRFSPSLQIQHGDCNVTLKLSNVTLEDTGRYTVHIILNGSSDIHKRETLLILQEPPVLLNNVLKLEVSESATRGTFLSCGRFTHMGFPSEAQVYWMNPAGNNFTSSRYEHGYFFLDITPCSLYGKYTCYVINQCLSVVNSRSEIIPEGTFGQCKPANVVEILKAWIRDRFSQLNDSVQHVYENMANITQKMANITQNMANINQISKDNSIKLNRLDSIVGDSSLQGPKGEPGAMGYNGSMGQQGPKGEPGAAGREGPRGGTGARGRKGETGAKGLKGDTGDKGDRGVIGPQGIKGDTGETGREGGLPGLDGFPGIPGLIGLPGPKGEPGNTGVEGPRGDTGATGPKGATGSTGPQGVKGETGAKGDTGIKGDKGVKGDKGMTGRDGPAGPMGEKGAVGPTGSQGPAGSSGPPGHKGEQGQPGATGPVGPKGEAGPQGPAGPQGRQGLPGLKGQQGGLPAPKCKDGWTTFEDSCYFLVNTGRSFSDAQSWCSSLRANLITINRESEDVFARKLAGNLEYVWIGLTDEVSEGNWYWVSGQPVSYDSWHPGEPNDTRDWRGRGGEDCAAIRPGKDWNDIECYHLYSSICERGME